jgi:hypothetical protein
MGKEEKRSARPSASMSRSIPSRGPRTDRGLPAKPWVEIVATGLALVYVLYRFFTLPLMGDEWGVLWSIYHHSFMEDIYVFRNDVEAQTQLLNLLLSKLCHQFLPLDEVQSIRVPSLFGLGMFLFFLWRLRLRFKNPFFRTLAFLALLANAFVLDYFTMSRGITLAFVFLVGTMCLLIEIGVREEPPDGWDWRACGAVWLATLAGLSHMAFMPAFGSVVVVLVLLWLRAQFASGRVPFWRLVWRFVADNLYLAPPILVLGLMCPPRVMAYNAENAGGLHRDWFGDSQGFVHDTVLSLVTCISYDIHLPTFAAETVTWILVVLSLGSGLAALRWLFRMRSRQGLWPGWVAMSVTILIMSLAIVAAHFAMGVPYPKGRWALYLLPVFVLQLACCADQLPKLWIRLPLGGVLVCCVVIGLGNLNLTHTMSWEICADVPKIVHDLETIHKRDGRPIVLYLSDGIKWQVWYYAMRMLGAAQNERVEDPGCGKTHDWLTVYEGYCGRARSSPRFFVPQTNYLLSSKEDEPLDWVPRFDSMANIQSFGKASTMTPKLVAEYRTSGLRLYARQ